MNLGFAALEVMGFAVQGLVMFLLDWTVLDRASAYSTALSMFRL